VSAQLRVRFWFVGCNNHQIRSEAAIGTPHHYLSQCAAQTKTDETKAGQILLLALSGGSDVEMLWLAVDEEGSNSTGSCSASRRRSEGFRTTDRPPAGCSERDHGGMDPERFIERKQGATSFGVRYWSRSSADLRHDITR
jgi:hypothetical protein